MFDLDTTFMHFEWQPDQAAYLLVNVYGVSYPQLKAVPVVHYRWRKRPMAVQGQDWSRAEVTGPTRIVSRQGPLLQIGLKGKIDSSGLAYRVVFSLAENRPLFLCQVTLTNMGADPLTIERIIHCQARRGAVQLSAGQDGQVAFFSNGWQSWSYTGTYGPGERQFRSHLGPFRQPLLVNPGTPRPGRAGHFGSDFFGVLGDRTHRSGLLAGFLSQQQQFGSLEAWTDPQPSFSLWANGDSTRLDPGASLTSDPSVITFIDLDLVDPLAPYLEAVALQHDLRPASPVMDGWCSWYYYYNHLSAADIRQNLAALIHHRDTLPLHLVQIDDGFESKIADWAEFSPGFGEGVALLAKEIREVGMTPGLWLAPFLVNPRSHLAHDHPDYLLRNSLKLPVISGATSEAWINYALDLSYPPAFDFACSVVEKAAHDWDYPYLKLDFISAGALPGNRFDRTRSRAQMMRAALEGLRRAAGIDTYLAGCGAPLGSGIGIFNSMRIGEDVAPTWEPHIPVLPGLFRRESEFPATRNAIHNILTRANLHQRWWVNDPDCLLVRPAFQTGANASYSGLETAEMQSLATAVGMSGGTYLLSDDLNLLADERLQLAASLFPPIDGRLVVLDWFDAANPSRARVDLDGAAGSWQLLAYFNWEDHPISLSLNLADYHLTPEKPYWVRSFWDQKTALVQDGCYVITRLAAHGAALLAVRPVHTGQPQYLGGNLHISQGVEVTAWQGKRDQVRLQLDLPRSASGQVELSLPFVPKSVIAVEGNKEFALSWKAVNQGRYLFEVNFSRSIEILMN